MQWDPNEQFQECSRTQCMQCMKRSQAAELFASKVIVVAKVLYKWSGIAQGLKQLPAGQAGNAKCQNSSMLTASEERAVCDRPKAVECNTPIFLTVCAVPASLRLS